MLEMVRKALVCQRYDSILPGEGLAMEDTGERPAELAASVTQ